MKCIPKQKHALKIKSDDKTKNFKNKDNKEGLITNHRCRMVF